MMRAWHVLLITVATGCIGSVSAAHVPSATEWFLQGNTAYEKGGFQEADTDYQKAEALGVANAALYYNHGNTLFRLNELGPAILFYERARKLAPLDEDINFNLRYAQSRVEDKVPEPESNLLTRLLWRLHAGYSLRSGLWVTLALFTLIFAFAATALLMTSFLRWFSMAGAAASFLCLLILSPSVVYKIYQQETEEYGIVMQPVVELFSGPGENYQVLAKVHEGTEFEIVEQHGDWLSVKLANGKGGFVRANQLGKV